MVNGIPFRNPDGYADPTAHDALVRATEESDAVKRRTDALIKSIKTLIDLSGYDLLARIEVRDRGSGKVFR